MKKHDSLEGLERLLRVRLEDWFSREKNEPSQPQPKPVLTITQEQGCGAESIATRLCSELHLNLYDWELVEQIAEDEQVSAECRKTEHRWMPAHVRGFRRKPRRRLHPDLLCAVRELE